MLGVGRAGPLGPVGLTVGEGDTEATVDVGTVAGQSPVGIDGGRGPLIGDERAAWGVLATVEDLGPVTLTRLVAELGTAGAVLDLARTHDGARTLGSILIRRGHRSEPLGHPIADGIATAANRASEILDTIALHDLRVVTVDDADYPSRLRRIEMPPPVLFARGSMAALDASSAVAVVGTRRPTEHGRDIASRIAATIARADAVVVSGLAVGIDGAAHAATVAVGRPTVAVLGSGHGQLYPAAHRRLADAIVDTGGSIVSELAPWVDPRRSTFPRRNRLISGLADATVVVEAGARSGALSTAAWALEQGRECFLVPGALDEPASVGCLRFLREQSGLARIVAGVPELIEDLGLTGKGERATDRRGARPVGRLALLAELGDVERTVASALIDGARTLDHLVAETHLAVATVLGALTLLEVRGLVVDALGRYRPSGLLATVGPARRGRRPSRQRPAAA